MKNTTINQNYNSEKDYISIVRNFGPGNLPDKQTIKHFDEIDLYFMIESLETFMLAYTINKIDKTISNKWYNLIDLNEVENVINTYYYCISQTKKFGVSLPITHMISKRFKLTDSYTKWFGFYLKHFSKMQTPSNEKTWQDFLLARKNGQDVSKFLPKDDWQFKLSEEDRSYFK